LLSECTVMSSPVSLGGVCLYGGTKQEYDKNITGASSNHHHNTVQYSKTLFCRIQQQSPIVSQCLPQQTHLCPSNITAMIPHYFLWQPATSKRVAKCSCTCTWLGVQQGSSMTTKSAALVVKMWAWMAQRLLETPICWLCFIQIISCCSVISCC
jgi:hypothetical protein